MSDDDIKLVDWVHFERSRSELGAGFIRTVRRLRPSDRGDNLNRIDGFNQEVTAEPAGLSLQDRIGKRTRDNRVKVRTIGSGPH